MSLPICCDVPLCRIFVASRPEQQQFQPARNCFAKADAFMGQNGWVGKPKSDIWIADSQVSLGGGGFVGGCGCGGFAFGGGAVLLGPEAICLKMRETQRKAYVWIVSTTVAHTSLSCRTTVCHASGSRFGVACLTLCCAVAGDVLQQPAGLEAPGSCAE